MLPMAGKGGVPLGPLLRCTLGIKVFQFVMQRGPCSFALPSLKVKETSGTPSTSLSPAADAYRKPVRNNVASPMLNYLPSSSAP